MSIYEDRLQTAMGQHIIVVICTLPALASTRGTEGSKRNFWVNCQTLL
jgi:hypothetical protein